MALTHCAVEISHTPTSFVRVIALHWRGQKIESPVDSITKFLRRAVKTFREGGLRDGKKRFPENFVTGTEKKLTQTPFDRDGRPLKCIPIETSLAGISTVYRFYDRRVLLFFFFFEIRKTRAALIIADFFFCIAAIYLFDFHTYNNNARTTFSSLFGKR